MGNLNKRFPRYSRLLKLYPAAYRREYGQQMLQTLADMLDGSATTGHRLSVWLRTATDLPLSITRQQVLFAAGVMAHDMPGYVKRSSLAGGLLLAPFFIFIVLDSLTAHSLNNSWLWHPWVGKIWLIFMPAAAFLVCAAAFLRWSADRRRRHKTSSWQLLSDWQHNWPMLLVVVLSLGIIAVVFGHDSVHCVVQNPVTTVRNWHTTLRCIRAG